MAFRPVIAILLTRANLFGLIFMGLAPLGGNRALRASLSDYLDEEAYVSARMFASVCVVSNDLDGTVCLVALVGFD